MVSHHDCLHFTADLERDIYGEVVSHSIQDHLDGCGFWLDTSWLKMESIR